MKLSDLNPDNLVRFAVYPLVVLLAGGAFIELLSRLGTLGLFLVLLLFLAASPLAYLIRNARGSRAQHHGARRGAERTPVLPHNQEEEP
jgi:hypothetical protein